MVQLIEPNPGPLLPELLRNAGDFERAAQGQRMQASVEEASGNLGRAQLLRGMGDNFAGLAKLLRRAAAALQEGDATASAHFLVCSRCSRPQKVRRSHFAEGSLRLTSWFHPCERCESEPENIS